MQSMTRNCGYVPKLLHHKTMTKKNSQKISSCKASSTGRKQIFHQICIAEDVYLVFDCFSLCYTKIFSKRRHLSLFSYVWHALKYVEKRQY